MAVLTEGKHPGEHLVHELPNLLSRKIGVLADDQDLEDGTVLGQVLTAGAATAVGTVTGNGAITVGAVGPDTVEGVYKLVCVAAATNAGTFNYYAPDGTLVRQITAGAGATASDHLTLTIADGAVDFAAGDTFTIAVTGGLYKILAPTATDGTQIAAGTLFGNVDATDADTDCVVVYKTAEVRDLVWPSGITTAQKATATAQLLDRGIVISAT